ncbi:MAG TPA: nuclear transport factor 2 family protein [Gammaproteobacteria bacterium]|nr:nuclear transport factor 2 family protein [Gammaproteobacteria bacterium]
MSIDKDEFEAEREKLRKLQAIFEKAVENNSIDDIKPFTHADFSFVSFTDKSFDSFDAFKNQWEITRSEMVGSGRFSTQLNPAPTIFVDDIAIASGNAQNTLVNASGEQFNFSNHWTVIFKRVDNDWKVLRAHNSLDPFANPMLVSGVKRNIIKYSALAFLGGAALCSVISYLIPG